MLLKTGSTLFSKCWKPSSFMVCTSSEYLSTKKAKVILKLLDISDGQIQSVEKKKKPVPLADM